MKCRSVAGGEGEPLRLPGAHVQDELGVLPRLELPVVDVEGAAADVPSRTSWLPMVNSPSREAHGQAAVAAAARLEEHDRPASAVQPGDGLERRRRGDDPGHRRGHADGRLHLVHQSPGARLDPCPRVR